MPKKMPTPQTKQNNAANSSETSMATQPGGSMTSRATSESRAIPGGSGGPRDSATVTGAKFRHGLLQLMIHTIDPMHDGEKFFVPFSKIYMLSSPKICCSQNRI